MGVFTIPAAYRQPRTSEIRWLVLHTNEGPERAGAARGLGAYLQLPEDRRGNRGGYHEIADSVDLVLGAAENEVVYGAAGGNAHGWHFCIVGQASQGSSQWLDPFSAAALEIAAVRIARMCVKYRIPIRKVAPSQVRLGEFGICGHDDISRAFGLSSHWDPGSGFPWTYFISKVRAAAARYFGNPDIPVPKLVLPSGDSNPAQGRKNMVLPVVYPRTKAGPQSKAGNRLAFYDCTDDHILGFNGASLAGDLAWPLDKDGKPFADPDDASVRGLTFRAKKVPVAPGHKIVGLGYYVTGVNTSGQPIYDYSTIVAYASDGGVFAFDAT